MINITNHPAYLLVGQNKITVKNTIDLLQKVLCKNNGCQECIQCEQIQEKKHHAILWLNPEKQYVLADIEPIFKTVSFSLEHDQHFFFILEKTETLNLSCCNSLLKIMEEPPEGYHFILLTEQENSILPTIKSRCIVNSWHNPQVHFESNPLAALFMTDRISDPSTFLQVLEKDTPNEIESRKIVDIILHYWIAMHKQAIIDNNKQAIAAVQSKINIIQTAVQKSPMPGSSKIFWKNIFLQVSTYG